MEGGVPLGAELLGPVETLHRCRRYFNYRTTRFLAEEGFYKFHNWFDDRAWYPLGRIIGGTIYPGKPVARGRPWLSSWSWRRPLTGLGSVPQA